MLIGSGLSPSEQIAFDILLRFFNGEEHAERKALALCGPFSALASMRLGMMSDEDVASTVMECLCLCINYVPEIELVFSERRDNRRAL